MTPIEQTINKIEDVLKAFRQNNRQEDYDQLLNDLAMAVWEWQEEEDK